MNWDDKAYEYAEARGSEYFGLLPEQMFEYGARWQRDNLRIDEAVVRVAVALFGDETELDWEYAAQWVQDDYKLFAHRAIDALLGEHP